ncbi:MAG: RecX family transcriptional regulator [Paraprevotella sp.]|nr:RecX family transcriptional regulator [Paraprevotella sp.]
MKEITVQEAFNKAAAYCSGAEYCTSDIRKKLERWGMDAPQQDDILNRLQQERFINEDRFCRCFVRDKFRYNQWGRIKIAQALRQKGLADSCARAALAELDEKEYTDTLRKLLQAKARTLRASSDYERNGKLVRFGLGRGFEMPLIMKCLHVDEEDFG